MIGKRRASGRVETGKVSGDDVADEVQMTHRGMMIAIPENEWVVFLDLSSKELAEILFHMAGLV